MKKSLIYVLLVMQYVVGSESSVQFVGIAEYLHAYSKVKKATEGFGFLDESCEWHKKACIDEIEYFALWKVGSNTSDRLAQRQRVRSRIAVDFLQEAFEQNEEEDRCAKNKQPKTVFAEVAYWKKEVTQRGMQHVLKSDYTDLQKINRYIKMLIDWQEHEEIVNQKFVAKRKAQ